MNTEDMERIQHEKNAVDRLSGTIIESFPQLMGFTRHNFRSSLHRQGCMVGKLFILCPLWVIQRAEFTAAVHKKTAAEIITWLNATHGLA